MSSVQWPLYLWYSSLSWSLTNFTIFYQCWWKCYALMGMPLPMHYPDFSLKSLPFVIWCFLLVYMWIHVYLMSYNANVKQNISFCCCWCSNASIFWPACYPFYHADYKFVTINDGIHNVSSKSSPEFCCISFTCISSCSHEFGGLQNLTA